MPELPEVQTFINHLKPLVTNHLIIGVEVNNDKILKNTTAEALHAALVGQQFTNLTRIGKYLIFHLNSDQVLVLHLRMEGKPYYQHKNDPYEYQHVLFRIKFSNDHELRYHDTRRFGTVHLFNAADFLEQKELAKLGWDPIDPRFNVDYVKKQLLTSPNRVIKTTLLDQTKISGIGNIYADEILFAAQIHPLTLVKNLSDRDFAAITTAATAIIKTAIKHHGTTILSFKYKHGEMGQFQNKLKVHTLKGLACQICNTTIIKTKVNGRGTYLCPECQIIKEPSTKKK
ncbi:formamidopyrimidine-DNA glycosylase [Mycoplasmoides fastidiosum]|uniref:Formamidopyrimidine-DNA glycosylase n=1 Tax=Mycoplasmoides fastidiosum TaxID=92758 RepID=A0ABU0LZS3_9BACT|nr:DNA-formamidopyrimidine glycosylase [Mycoplasmoides fastidiosum]MDQ0514201.1 formamidopyrimidine-DNA glycosylase [Mycoplasmoides fastidiosum]UUD37389.1 DNA-formamidopyrimidine glycosylase [Mycoplasmoides fastidiosum]